MSANPQICLQHCCHDSTQTLTGSCVADSLDPALGAVPEICCFCAPVNCYIYKQPLIQLWTLPSELKDIVSLSELPLLGASPDRLLDTDPAMPDSASDSVLELKSKVPFSHFRKQWRFIDESKPSTHIEAAHFAQIQLKMLVTGKSQAYLVYWSCTVTNTFRVVIDFKWLKEALTLLQEINIHPQG